MKTPEERQGHSVSTRESPNLLKARRGISSGRSQKLGVGKAELKTAIPAPETSHAISVVVEEAKKAKEEGKEKVILLNWSGHGIMDLGGYESYFSGKLVDYPLPEEEMRKSLKDIEGWPKPKIMKKGKVVG
jgi:tryptophan synthase beta chain